MRLPLLLAAFLGLFLSLWTVVPAFTMQLLVFGVGAPEVSPWLLAGNALVAGLSLWWGVRPAWVGALAGVALCLVPMIQVPFAVSRVWRELSTLPGVALSPPRAGFRSTPLSLLDWLRGASGSAVVQRSSHEITASGGHRLRLLAWHPPSGGPSPIVVVIHGGAWRGGVPTEGEALSRHLAAQGYLVCALTYRFAPTHPYPAQMEDVRTGLAWLRLHAAEFGADMGRLALLGRSAGGHLALLAAYEPDAPPVRAVVAFYPPTHLKDGYDDLPRPDPIGVRRVLDSFLGGPPSAVPARYAAASPATYAARPQPPTLLLHGSRDHIVKVGFSRRLQRELRAAGNTALLVEFPWSEHAYDVVAHGPASQLSTYAVERFLAWAVAR